MAVFVLSVTLEPSANDTILISPTADWYAFGLYAKKYQTFAVPTVSTSAAASARIERIPFRSLLTDLREGCVAAVSFSSASSDGARTVERCARSRKGERRQV